LGAWHPLRAALSRAPKVAFRFGFFLIRSFLKFSYQRLLRCDPVSPCP
jgi:hypothetical protein